MIKVDILSCWILGPFTVCPLAEDMIFGVHLKCQLISKFEPLVDIFGRQFLKSPCFIEIPLQTPASYLLKDARWQWLQLKQHLITPRPEN